jgi:HSP20 family protein
MTMITRIDPFRELATLQDRFTSLFENFTETPGKEQLAAGSFVPPADIYEDEHILLTVSGERKFEKEEKEENFHRIERRYGSFARTFRPPNTIDPEKVEAGYDKGLLEITVAKRAEAKPKQIKVGNGHKTLQG